MPHYYDRVTGLLLPSVELKVRPGEWRDPDLRDARKVNALVSTTTFIDIIDKPGMDKWRVVQGIKAVLSLVDDMDSDLDPMFNDDSRPQFIAQMVKKSEEYTKYAQDWGNAFHWWVSQKLRAVQTNEIPPMIPHTEECAEAFLEWCEANGFVWEKTEHRWKRSDLGSAGTVDLLGTHYGEPCIADMKSQEPPLTPYDPEHPLQLSSYAEGCELPLSTPRYSLIVNRLQPGDVKMHLWQDDGKTVEETNSRYDTMFSHLREFWFLAHKYDPRSLEGATDADPATEV